MGWAARNKYKGSHLGFSCSKCHGTGIRGFRVNPFNRDEKKPIKCKCTLKKEAMQRQAEADARALERFYQEKLSQKADENIE